MRNVRIQTVDGCLVRSGGRDGRSAMNHRTGMQECRDAGGQATSVVNPSAWMARVAAFAVLVCAAQAVAVGSEPVTRIGGSEPVQTAPSELSSQAAPIPDAPSARGDRALVVGIDRYADPGITDLRGAARDAHNIQWLLTEHLGFAPEGIRVLTDEAATRRGIVSGIRDWLVAGTQPGAKAWLYFSGHGYFQTDKSGDEADGYDEALVPHDARLVSVEARPMEVANLIFDDEMRLLLDQLHDREVHVIVDSCHAGTMTRSLAPPVADPRYARTLGLGMTPGTDTAGTRSLTPSAFTRVAVVARQREVGFIDTDNNHTVWTAVSPLQLALEDRDTDEPQGVFTGRFVRGIADRLADRNRDGRVVHAELLDYVRSESEVYCTRYPRDCEEGLTPTLEGRRDLLIADVVTGEPLIATSETAVSETAESALGHSNVAEVQLEILPSARVRVGEAVTYRVRSGRAGHLLLVDVAADGTVTQLFPNRFSEQSGESATLGEGRPVEVPNAYYGFQLVASPPHGRGSVFAVVTEDPISLDDLVGPNRDLRPVASAREWLLALGERLRAPWLEESGTRQNRWSAARVAYEIVQ